jgi:tetratricopeptide (TPR) repeat protein
MLVVLTLGVYWPVQNYEFINYDDQLYVTENFRVQNGITLKSIKDTFTNFHTGHWHPLTMISHMLDWQMYGNRAGGHHWTSVVLHIINAILLFFLFRNLTGALWRSAFVATLFAIHPINVESVAWIAERKNVLSTFFFILTMLFYVWYVKQPNWKRYLPVFISFALGLLSKPMLVTLPFVLLLMDYWPLKRIDINTRNEANKIVLLKEAKEKLKLLIVEKVPLFILTAFSIFFTYYASIYVNDIQSIESLPVIKRISNAVFSYALYVKKLFWPNDLSVFYPFSDIVLWQISLAAMFLVSITLVVLKYFRKHPYLFVGWFWFIGTLVPVIGIVQVGSQAMADRYAYITFIGLFIMMAWGIQKVSSRNIYVKKMFVVASVLMIMLFTAASYHQVKLWSNTITLFEDAIKKNPDNYLAYQIVGLEMYKKEENEKALQFNEMAIKANPRIHAAYNNQGLVLMKMGKRDEALKNFEMALQVNKSASEVYYNMGQIYLDGREFDKSIEYSLKAIELNPDYLDAYNNLGVALVKRGSFKDGIMQFEKALQINPNYEKAKRNLQIIEKMKNK